MSRRFGRFVGGLLLSVLFVAPGLRAEDYSAMGISAVISTANGMLQRGDYAAAIPALKEIIARTHGDSTYAETTQECRYQLARAYLQVSQVEPAMNLLDQYLNNEPRKKERLALRLMAQGMFETKDWNKVAGVARRLLKVPGLLSEEKVTANLFLGQALFRQKKWGECVDPLLYVAERTKDDRIRKTVQIMAANAMVEAKLWGRLFAWLPRLYRTDAKYDIALNITLMNAGKAAYERATAQDTLKDYLNALLLYRMVLPREDLVAHAEKDVAELQAQYERLSKVASAEKEERKAQIDALKASIEELKGLPPYEDEVVFRIGQIYAEVKRYWEGYVLFDHLYRKDRTSEIGEMAMMQSVLVLYDLGVDDRAAARVLQYLDERPEGRFARILLSMLMRNNLDKAKGDEKYLEKVVSLRGYVEGMPPPTTSEDKQVQSELYYMLAFGFLQRKDFKEAAEQFDVIVADYSDSTLISDAVYYRGMTRMMLGDYKSALDDFQRYRQKYPTGEHVSATLFRMGVCQFGMNHIDQAEKIFSEFIEKYPKSDLISEAYAMRADIMASKDNAQVPDALDRAISDYHVAIEKSTLPVQAAYAAFQAAKVYKLEYRWQEIVDLMNYYLDLKEKDADVANATFWIGRAQIEMGQVEDAVDAYIRAIKEFGGDVDQLGVDKIIRELINLANGRLGEDAREDLIARLRSEEVAAGSPVLKLRLRVAIAYLHGRESFFALGKELLKEKTDFKIATPISLALMCDTAVDVDDTNRMDRLYRFFVDRFEDSDEIWHAYRAKMYQLEEAGDEMGALEIIDEAQGLFGVESFMGWAQISKADILFRQKRYDEAKDAYNVVFGVAEWRGPLFAEAMFGMGKCAEAKGDYAKAHAFYQRTYLLYKNYDNGVWAAEAYRAAARCLVKLGEKEKAAKTLRAMLEDPYVNTLPQAEAVRKKLK